MPVIDVRTVAPRESHPLILSTFQALPAGQHIELVNDHDPRPLYYQFAEIAPGEFEWDYLEKGPDTWRVAITRTAEPRARNGGSCCGGGGACGG
jgi:uncharacterized protein (DUF2249 family)